MYKIYKSNSTNPKQYGRRMRILYSVMLLIPTVIIIITVTSDKLSQTANNIIDIVGLALIIIIAAYYVFKTLIKPMKEIGCLEFRKNCMEKSVGGLTEVFPYNEIKSLKIEKFLKSIMVRDSWKIYSKYILEINTNNQSVSIIVGDKSISHNKISILDSISYLKTKGIVKVEMDV